MAIVADNPAIVFIEELDLFEEKPGFVSWKAVKDLPGLSAVFGMNKGSCSVGVGPALLIAIELYIV